MDGKKKRDEWINGWEGGWDEMDVLLGGQDEWMGWDGCINKWDGGCNGMDWVDRMNG